MLSYHELCRSFIVYDIKLQCYKKNSQLQIETDVPKRRNYVIRKRICIVLKENIMITSKFPSTSKDNVTL